MIVGPLEAPLNRLWRLMALAAAVALFWPHAPLVHVAGLGVLVGGGDGECAEAKTGLAR